MRDREYQEHRSAAIAIFASFVLMMSLAVVDAFTREAHTSDELAAHTMERYDYWRPILGSDEAALEQAVRETIAWRNR